MQFNWELINDHRFRVFVETQKIEKGTLSRLTAAMYMLGFDVVSGNMYTIKKGTEWVSRDDFVLEVPHEGNELISVNESTARLGELMEIVLTENLEPEALFSRYNVLPPESPELFRGLNQIEFKESSPENTSRLYLRAKSRRGLLFYITSVLASLSINIIGASILTTDQGIAEDTLDIQFDHQALSQEMQSEIFNQLKCGST